MIPELIVDLDGVILDTRKWIADLKQLLIDNGVPAEKVASFYSDPEVHKPYRSRTMYLINHVSELSSMLGVEDTTQIQKAIADYLNRLPEYIFSDAWDFLGHYLMEDKFLLTYGGVELQELKIERLTIAHYFNDVIITSGGKKTDAIASLKATGQVGHRPFFIDDTLKEVERVKAFYPEIRTILVDRWNEYGNDTVSDYKVCSLLCATGVIEGKLFEVV